MGILIAFAFLSGVVTILSPCILPVLPVVLSGSAGGRARPIGIVLGFVASFSAFTLGLSALVQRAGLPAEWLRGVAVALLIGFGIVLLVPALKDRFQLLLSRSFAPTAGGAPRAGSGFLGGLPIGVSLGLVWTPCAGPIMASVISLAIGSGVDSGSVLITLAYALGTAVPMLAVMAGGRALIARTRWLNVHARAIQRAFGVLMILVGVGVAAGLEQRLQTAVLEAAPGYGASLTALEDNLLVHGALEERARAVPAAAADGTFQGSGHTSLAWRADLDYGAAPALPTAGIWFNSAPLTMDGLRGKVVLIDFWTFDCVNCVRTIPHLRALHETHAEAGLVIIGVHAPEYDFERIPANVRAAIERLGIAWPVVLDNDFATWNAYRNRYWPACYLIDARGRVRYSHFGEGAYEEQERAVAALLRERG